MSKLRVELNSAGVRALMRSPEMQAVLKARADTVKNRCGDGYEAYVAQPVQSLWWRLFLRRPTMITLPTTPC